MDKIHANRPYILSLGKTKIVDYHLLIAAIHIIDIEMDTIIFNIIAVVFSVKHHHP